MLFKTLPVTSTNKQAQNGLSKKIIIIIMAYSYFSVSPFGFSSHWTHFQKSPFHTGQPQQLKTLQAALLIEMESSFLTPEKLSGKVLISLWGHVTTPEPASQSLGLGMQYSGGQSRECAHPWGPGLFSLCMQGYDSLRFSVSACKGWIIPERKRCC